MITDRYISRGGNLYKNQVRLPFYFFLWTNGRFLITSSSKSSTDKNQLFAVTLQLVACIGFANQRTWGKCSCFYTNVLKFLLDMLNQNNVMQDNKHKAFYIRNEVCNRRHNLLCQNYLDFYSECTRNVETASGL